MFKLILSIFQRDRFTAMFYEQSQIEPNLSCDKCQHRYQIPKLLACGESICDECARTLKSSIKADQTEFECPLCADMHELPKSGEFPVNKKLLAILKQRPCEIRRTEPIETLKFHLYDCQTKVNELRTMLINNGVDKVQACCQDLRTEVYLETERKIEALYEMSAKLIDKICDYEKECLAALESKEIEKHFPAVLVKEFTELDEKWKQVIQHAEVDEQQVDEANERLKRLQARIDVEIFKLNDVLFNNQDCQFRKYLGELSGDIIGTIRMLPKSQKRFRASAEIECVKTIKAVGGAISMVAMETTGLICSGSMEDDNGIRVWNADTGDLVKSLKGHGDLVWALTVLPGCGLLCSGSGDGSIRVWDVDSGVLMNTLTGHRRGYAVMALTALQNDQLVSGSGDQTVRVWNVSTGCSVKTLSGHSNGVMALAVLPSGLLCSGSGDQTIRVWNCERGQLVRVLNGHTRGVMALTVLANGLLCSGAGDHTIRVWNVDSGQIVRTISEHRGDVMALVALDNGDFCSGSADSTIKIWNVDCAEPVKTLASHGASVMTLSVLGNGDLCSGSSDKTFRIWH